jgi:hypothetical protein
VAAFRLLVAGLGRPRPRFPFIFFPWCLGWDGFLDLEDFPTVRGCGDQDVVVAAAADIAMGGGRGWRGVRTYDVVVCGGVLVVWTDDLDFPAQDGLVGGTIMAVEFVCASDGRFPRRVTAAGVVVVVVGASGRDVPSPGRPPACNDEGRVGSPS